MSYSPEKSEKILAAIYKRNGCMRLPNAARRKAEKNQYKKGFEIRLIASSEEELQLIREALLKSGFKPGKPYAKVRQFVQPVYGKKAVEKFKSLLTRA